MRMNESTGGLGGSTPDFQRGGSGCSIPEPVTMEIFKYFNRDFWWFGTHPKNCKSHHKEEAPCRGVNYLGVSG